MKRALLVGIDHYRTSPLRGCVNDVNALAPLLARHEDGSLNFQCQSVTSNSTTTTRDRLLEALDRLFAPGADVSLLYFAGHGSEQRNDVTLVTQDSTRADPGVSLSEVFGRIEGSPVREIIVILDCCFSGGAGGSPQISGDTALLRQGVSLLTASRSDQTAAETPDGRGAFSSFLCGALDGGAADVLGKVTLAGVYAYLSESFGAWDQRPMFKANVDRINELRQCAPAVPLAELRRLPELFPTPDYDFPLDPSYEPDAEPPHPENHGIFAILQHCRSAKLVEPVGADHMYYAAMERKICRLTPLGRHYRRLAEQGLL